MAIKLLMVGSDMEVFLRDNLSGVPVPVCGLIGGTKEKPKEVLGGNGFAVQEDNVMLEFNIPPANTADKFSANFQQILAHIEKEVAEIGLHVDISPSMQFLPEMLLHPQASHIGCEPDFNAYTSNMRRVKLEEMKTLRCAGGHIHVSFEEEADPIRNPDGVITSESRVLLVKALDVYLGLPSLVFDKDMVRRGLYGKPGMFRPKSYGIEYRSLSNAWLRSPTMIRWVFGQVEKAVALVNTNKFLPDSVEKIMLDTNIKDATMLMEYYNVGPLPQAA